MHGYWTDVGAPAGVDWCEPDYSWTPWVAEPWNTASSLVIAALGVWGFWQLRGAPLRFRMGMLGTCGVGLGSAAFHGTLLRVAQAADELPMLWLGLGCAWTMSARGVRWQARARLAVVLATFGTLFTVAYAGVPWAFSLFIGVYALIVAWLAVRTTQLSLADPRLGRWARLVVGAYVGSFAAFWLPEHVLLPCDHPLQGLQLHSLWHVGAGIGTWAYWRWAAEGGRAGPERDPLPRD